MSQLIDLVDDSKTDKNTVHSYLPTYNELFHSIKDTAKTVGEIGIFRGGSIKLWHDYFVNADVHGLDIMSIDDVWPNLKDNDRIHLHTSIDAYNDDFVLETFKNKNIKFDMILDDGPHTLESMIKCVQLYLPLVSDNGIFVIEDVQSIDWIPSLKEVVPQDLQEHIQVFDLRSNKNRYDDIIFVVNKSKIK